MSTTGHTHAPTACPNDAILAAYYLKKLDDDQCTRDVEAHLEICVTCRADLDHMEESSKMDIGTSR